MNVAGGSRIGRAYAGGERLHKRYRDRSRAGGVVGELRGIELVGFRSPFDRVSGRWRDDPQASFGSSKRDFKIEHRLQDRVIREEIGQRGRGRQCTDQTRRHLLLLMWCWPRRCRNRWRSSRGTRRYLDVEENGFLIARKVDVDSPSATLIGIRASHQAIAAILRNQGQDGILRIGRIAKEVDASRQTFENPARQDRNVQVRRLEGIVPTRNSPRLDGLKITDSARIGPRTPVSKKFWVDWLLLGVVRVVVFPVGIRLPELEHGIGNGVAFSVEDPADELHPFAFGTGAGHPRDRTRAGQANLKERANRLRSSWNQVHLTPRKASLRDHEGRCQSGSPATIQAA